MAKCWITDCEKPATEKGEHPVFGPVDLCPEHKKSNDANILAVAPIPNKEKDEKKN
jgi:hypothetical protein